MVIWHVSVTTITDGELNVDYTCSDLSEAQALQQATLQVGALRDRGYKKISEDRDHGLREVVLTRRGSTSLVLAVAVN